MENEVEEVLGKSVSVSGEYGYKLVFLKDDKIVHHFESSSNLNQEDLGRLVFMDMPDVGIYIVYDQSVVFDSEQQNETESVTYLLSCKNCE